MAADPNLDDLAREIQENPRTFALRFAELIADVKDVQAQIRKGTWLAFTVLVGVIVDLALRLSEHGAATQVAQAVSALFT